jgi:hypothetical protein
VKANEHSENLMADEFDFDEFMQTYYLVRPSDRVGWAVEHASTSLPPVGDSGFTIAAAFLGHVARHDADVRDQLEAVRRSQDDRSAAVCLATRALAVADDPAGELARESRPLIDLDFLWAEFCASGDPAPVLRVIDAIDRPDRARERLEKALAGQPSGIRGRLARRRLLRAVEGAGIELDAGQMHVTDESDLDLVVARAPEIVDALELDADARAFVTRKAVAAWSLQAFARRHELVAHICADEAGRRAASTSSLLDVTAREASFLRHEEARQRLLEELAPELRRVMELSTDGLRAVDAAEVVQEALQCVEGSASTRAHVTEAELRVATGEGWEAAGGWQAEWVAPDGYRVFQWVDDDGDAWMFVGSEYFTNPGAWVAIEGREADEEPRRALSELLRADLYADVARIRAPTAAGHLDSQVGRLIVVRYDALGHRDARRLLGPLLEDGSAPAGLELLLDPRRLRVVRTTMELRTPQGKVLRLVRAFAGYDREVEIVPPPASPGMAWMPPDVAEALDVQS